MLLIKKYKNFDIYYNIDKDRFEVYSNSFGNITGNSCKDLHNKIDKIIPKEKFQQETIEEAAEKFINDDLDLFESLVDGHITYHVGMDLLKKIFIEGAKWQMNKQS